MTSDEFKAAYWPGQVLTSEGVRTTIAQELKKGRIVLMHELAAAPESDQRRATELLDQLNPTDARLVIGTFDVDGATVIVTKFLPGFTNLLDWLEAASSDAPSDAARITEAANGPPSETFTKLFADPPSPPPETPVPITPDESRVEPPPPSPRSTPAPPLDPPSESFTKLFGSVPVPQPPPAHPTSESFTELFGRALAPPNEPRGSGESISAVFGSSQGKEPGPLGDPVAKSPAEYPGNAPRNEDISAFFGFEASPTPPPAAGQRSLPLDPVRELPPPPPGPAKAIAPNAPDFGSRPPSIDDHPTPHPPRIRAEIFDPGITTDPRSDARGPATPVPSPFSAAPSPSADPAMGPPSFPPAPFDSRTPARPVVRSAAPVEGTYTEVLTPARPPINAAASRAPTPAAPQPSAPAAPPRPSYLPLIIGLSVIGLVAVVLVVYVVMSAG